MRYGPPDEVLAGAVGWRCVVSSWLGGRLLSADVPVSRGRITAAVAQQGVTERLALTVPRRDGEMDWRPGDDATHPLARYGQELQVSIVTSSTVTGQEWETRVGRFVITEWDDDEASVSVTGEGMLRRVSDDKLTSPMAPLDGGTLMSEARRLLPLGMSAAFDPALVDRACPAGMAWSEDRLAALQEIANAWPARLRTDEWGQVQFLAPLPMVPSPVLTFTDGERGTLVSAPRSDTRTGSHNRVVARSAAAGTEDVQAIAEVTAGPMSVTGPYGPVTRVWSSPLIRDVSQALAAAQTMLRSSILPTRSIPVQAAADPRVALDDAAAVVRSAGTDAQETPWGWVTGYDLPLTVEDGDMRVDVGVSS